MVQYSASKNLYNDFTKLPRPHNSIAYILSGGGVFKENGREIFLSKGDMVFVPQGAKYTINWENSQTEIITCHFNFPTFYSVLGMGKTHITEIKGYEHFVTDFVFFAENQFENEKTVKFLSKFYKILDTALEHIEIEKYENQDERIKKAISYIEEHCTENITVKDIADYVNLSESHFYAYFKSKVGISPVKYKNKAQIEKANNMLTGDYTIENIAAKCGFESASYFRRVFKKYNHISPKEYRNKIKLHF